VNAEERKEISDLYDTAFFSCCESF